VSSDPGRQFAFQREQILMKISQNWEEVRKVQSSGFSKCTAFIYFSLNTADAFKIEMKPKSKDPFFT
jgi:hypothetical protein